MPEKFEGSIPPQEDNEIKVEYPEDYKIAKKALTEKAGLKALGSKTEKESLRFSTDEFESIKRAWNDLDPEIQDLTKTVFPEVAAYLLANKLGNE